MWRQVILGFTQNFSCFWNCIPANPMPIYAGARGLSRRIEIKSITFTRNSIEVPPPLSTVSFLQVLGRSLVWHWRFLYDPLMWQSNCILQINMHIIRCFLCSICRIKSYTCSSSTSACKSYRLERKQIQNCCIITEQPKLYCPGALFSMKYRRSIKLTKFSRDQRRRNIYEIL